VVPSGTERSGPDRQAVDFAPVPSHSVPFRHASGCHPNIGDPALADAALDRVVHNAHHIMLTPPLSMYLRLLLTKAIEAAEGKSTAAR